MSFDPSPIIISLKISAVSTVFVFFLGIYTARFMLKAKGLTRLIGESFLTLPLVLPPTVVGFALLMFLGSHGPLGGLWERWNFSLIFTWQAAAIASVVVSFPLMYRSVKSSFEQISPDLLDCARVFGAGEKEILWKIMVPLSLPGIISGLILSFARAMGEFGATIMVAGSIPGKTQSMSLALYFASQSGDTKTALMWAVIIYIISTAVIMASLLLERSHKK